MRNPFISGLPRWFAGLLLIIGLIILPNVVGMIALSYQEENKPTLDDLLKYENLRNIIQIVFAYLGLGLTLWCFFYAGVILIFHDKKAVETE